MNPNYYCVIMAGGVGSRFWPMSRQNKPKQFIDILGTGESLLQSTFDRVKNFCLTENIIVVTNSKYADLVGEQLPDLPKHNILSEPSRRDTAPCVAYAAYKIHLRNADAVMAVLPSDHLITKEERFTQTMLAAFACASENEKLLTLGIKPTRPDTGYGYIQFDASEKPDKHGFVKVKTFTEKPNLEMATLFLNSGDFAWNSGMFVWKSKVILEAFQQFQPEIINLFKEKPEVYDTDKEQKFIDKVYATCTAISIDYGIMEYAPNVFMTSADLGWSDLGTWYSLYDNSKKDKKKNVIIGKNTMLFGTENCVVNCPQEKLVVIGSVKDLIISEYEDMLLVCKMEEEQKIKHFVNEISIEKGDKFL